VENTTLNAGLAEYAEKSPAFCGLCGFCVERDGFKLFADAVA